MISNWLGGRRWTGSWADWLLIAWAAGALVIGVVWFARWWRDSTNLND